MAPEISGAICFCDQQLQSIVITGVRQQCSPSLNEFQISNLEFQYQTKGHPSVAAATAELVNH
jgi:hypothetical protein